MMLPLVNSSSFRVDAVVVVVGLLGVLLIRLWVVLFSVLAGLEVNQG